MNSVITTILKFGISFGILGFLFYNAWQEGQFQQLATVEKKWEWLFLALALGVTASLIAFYRWWVLVRALEIPFPLIDAIRLGFMSHLFNLASVGVLGGDAIKAIFAARQARHRMPEAVASVVVDRAIGLLAMFSVASIAYWVTDFSSLGAQHPEILKAIKTVCVFTTIISLCGFGAIGILFVAPRYRKLPIFQKLKTIPRVGPLIRRLAHVLLVYRSKKSEVIAAFIISVALNGMFAMSIYSVAKGITDSHPTLLQHLVISPIAMVANAVPLPGGLGGMEFALDMLYKGFSPDGAKTDNGFAVAIGYRLVWLFVAAIGVVVYLFSKREISQMDELKNQLPESTD